MAKNTTSSDAVTGAAEDGAAAPKVTTEADAAEATSEAAVAAAAAETEAAAAAVPPLVLEASAEMALNGTDLLAHIAGQPDLCLIFGSNGVAVPDRPVAVSARDLVADGGNRVRFTGNLAVLGGPVMGPGRKVDAVALADGPDGPVRAVCPLGPFVWAAGSEFAFGPGAFVFEGKAA